jgi:NAD(P)-dependent dehydrogenase (short-subunit alcohol dehydrogenase family)
MVRKVKLYAISYQPYAISGEAEAEGDFCVNSLEGKVAIVTGAGRGIGKAVSLSLAKAGCRVILAARTREQIEAVQKEILSNGGDALAVPTDLTLDEDIYRLIETGQEKWGPVDILINNAGWGKRAAVVGANVNDWDRTFRVNLRAPMLLAKALLPHMITKGEGAVINIGSVSGKTGEANGAAYSASKFGLIGFTQSLYEEVREHGIKVAVILPGFVDTPLIPPNRQLDRSKMIQADDIAQSVLFVLTSPATCCPVEITVRPQKTPYR